MERRHDKTATAFGINRTYRRKKKRKEKMVFSHLQYNTGNRIRGKTMNKTYSSKERLYVLLKTTLQLFFFKVYFLIILVVSLSSTEERRQVSFLAPAPALSSTIRKNRIPTRDDAGAHDVRQKPQIKPAMKAITRRYQQNIRCQFLCVLLF